MRTDAGRPRRGARRRRRGVGRARRAARRRGVRRRRVPRRHPRGRRARRRSRTSAPTARRSPASLASVRVLDRVSGEVDELAPADCGLRYRSSMFKRSDRHVVLAVTFALERSARSQPIALRGARADARRRDRRSRAARRRAREAVLELRRAKGMVLDAADHDTWSAGSFFTNPILEPAGVRRPRGAGRERPASDGIPRFAEADGRVKTSAAWLIERAGFRRGDARGGHRAVAQARARAHQPRRRDDGASWSRSRPRSRRRVEARFGVRAAARARVRRRRLGPAGDGAARV